MTRKGGDWERKTDDRGRGEKRDVSVVRGSLCCSLVSVDGLRGRGAGSEGLNPESSLYPLLLVCPK